MKKYLFFILISFSSIYSQVGIVKIGHPIYQFLQRMHTNQIISKYDEFQLPKTRKQISNYLNQVIENKLYLNNIDKKILDDFLVEFEFDLLESINKSSKLLPFNNGFNLFDNKERYLYYFTDSSKFNVFVNGFIQNNFIYENNRSTDESRNVNLIKYGGELRASFLKNLGFSIYGSNGTFQGDKSLAQTQGSLRYNFKFNYDKLDEGGVDFFDETEGFFIGDWDVFNFKIGRDRVNIGYGKIKSLIGSNSPPFDYISLNVNYSILGFSYFHGKLLGTETRFSDPVQGQIKTISDKYLAYHRISFDFGKHLNLSFGEMLVYSNRSIDFAYLNPFNYYKSAEHANLDRDNSMLFVDFQNNSIKGLSLYGMMLIDDLDFGKLGTSYFGNQALIELGVKTIPFYNSFPIEFEMQYIRIDPYVYTHRIHDNNFANNDFSLSDILNPNSEIISLSLNYPLTHRLFLNAGFTYTIHGANETDLNGNVLTNFGGNVLVGHREIDSDDAKFLDGIREYSRILNFDISYEPINNYYIGLITSFRNSTPANSIKQESILANIYFSLKL